MSLKLQIWARIAVEWHKQLYQGNVKHLKTLLWKMIKQWQNSSGGNNSMCSTDGSRGKEGAFILKHLYWCIAITISLRSNSQELRYLNELVFDRGNQKADFYAICCCSLFCWVSSFKLQFYDHRVSNLHPNYRSTFWLL